MIRNYLRVALRGFQRRALFTVINIIGLSIGITAALAIYLIVHFDFSFDRFYPNSDKIFRVVANISSSSGEEFHNGGVVGPLPEAVRTAVTGLDGSAPFYIVDEFALNHAGVVIPSAGKASLKFKYLPDVILADQRYFDLLPYTWVVGSKQNLNQPFIVALTTEKARKYYPSLSFQDMLGKIVIYGDSIKATIGGIVETHHQNTDFKFTDFLSYSTAAHTKILKDNIQSDNWGSLTPSSQFFVKLANNNSVPAVESRMNAIVKAHDPNAGNNVNIPRLHLEKLSDVHFDDQYASFNERTANKATLYGLLIIGLFLLTLACINFINLATAQASQRAKEIGIRKTMGGSRFQLIVQYLGETFVLTVLASIISIFATPFVLRAFADFIPQGVTANFAAQPEIFIFMFLLSVTVSLASGLYPALILSGYKPAVVLKNQTSSGTGESRNAFLRKSLTVSQFVIAQFFMVATFFVSRQVYFVLHKDLGFRKEAILSIAAPWNAKDPGLKYAYLNAVRSLPQVENVSMGGAAPSSDNTHSTGIIYTNGRTKVKTDVQERFGDENYRKVYGIKLLAGRDLEPGDASTGFLINNCFAKALGFDDVSKAVGSLLNYSGRDMRVIGVIGDFYYRSLHSPIKPLVIVTRNDNGYFSSTLHIALKPQTSAGNEWKMALTGIEAEWKKIYPDDVFQYQFFDESIAKFYEGEQHTSTLLSWAMALSVVISCLGLLGLAVYTTTHRKKEIAVRKVLGASVLQVVTLLSGELIRLVALSFLIATPVVWFAMNKWIQNYADRTTLSWWVFALSGVGMLFAALITSGFQTVRAAIVNPAKSLKTE